MMNGRPTRTPAARVDPPSPGRLRPRNVAVGVILVACVLGGVVLSVVLAGRAPGVTALFSPQATVSAGQRPARSNQPAVPAGRKVPPPRSGQVYWGGFASGIPRRQPLAALIRRAGQRPAIVMWYQDWSNNLSFPAQAARRLAGLGIVPMITWEPWKPPKVPGTPSAVQPRYRLARITAGAFDRYLTRYAREIKRYGGPVMLRPFHEMDGYWYPWGGTANGNRPQDFVPAWHHVHDLFARLGVHNVTWVWSVNATSVPLSPHNTPEEYWPGRRYVDWIGISGFNFGNSRSFGTWVSFDTLFKARIAELRRYHKPIVLTEISSTEVGGDKAAWIKQTFSRLDGYPIVGAVIWYDHRDSRLEDWRIRSSQAAQGAFRRAIAARNVRSAPAAFRAATTAR